MPPSIMNWFYAREGQQIGPVDEGELDGLVRRGEIIASTLVWRSGLSAWKPYNEVRPAIAPVAPTERPAVASTTPDGSVVCAECGRSFPPDDVITLGEVPVCAECKPIVLQKMREGVALRGDLPYAGFWVRVVAATLDGLIILPFAIAIWGGAFYYYPSVFSDAHSMFQLFVQLVMATIGIVYETYFVGRFGATPGKMVCNLQVVRSDGARITYARSLGRHFAKSLSGFTLCIGYLMAAFDEQKRGLHDHICDTRVVRKAT